MRNIFSVFGYLLVILISSQSCTASQHQNLNQSTPSSDWVKVSTRVSVVQELTFTANGDLFALLLGGLLRSTDNGRTWTEIKVKVPSDYSTLTCMAAFSDGLILVGAKSSGGDGSVILRSSDNGKSWEQVKFKPKDESEILNYEIESLTINSNGDLFAGTDFGSVFRSMDKGKTWMAISKVQPFETVAALAFGLEEHLYAAVAHTGIFRSDDGGKTWKETGYGKNSVDSVVVNKKGHIFAGTLKRGVFRSIDEGKTWTSISEGLPTLNFPVLALDKDGYLYTCSYGTMPASFFRSAYSTMDDRAFTSKPN